MPGRVDWKARWNRAGEARQQRLAGCAAVYKGCVLAVNGWQTAGRQRGAVWRLSV